MKQLKRVTALSLSVLFLFLFTACGSRESRAQRRFDTFLQNAFVSYMEEDFISAHNYLREPKKYDVKRDKQTVSLGFRPNQESFEQVRQSNQSLKESISKVDRSLLAEQQQDSFDLFQFQLETDQMLYQEKFDDYHTFFSPVNGIQNQLPIYFVEYRAETEQDIKDMIALLQDARSYLDVFAGYAKLQQSRGTLLADCAAVASYCRSVADEGENSAVLAAVQTKIEALPLKQEQKKAYQDQSKQAVEASFLPAYRELAEVMEQLDSTQNSKGLAALPEGKAYYEALFRSEVGSAKAVEAYQEQLQQFGQTQRQTMKDIMLQNPEAYRFLLSNDFQTTFTDYPAMLVALKEKILVDYPDMGEIPYTVNPIPPQIAGDGMAAYFSVPPLDGNQPRSIRVNQNVGMQNLSAVDTFQTMAHEGFPGHLYQNAYAQKQLQEQPWRMTMFSFPGYTEGYAVYTQINAAAYLDFPADVTTSYQASQLLEFSLIAQLDIGLHYNGWSIEEAQAFLKTHGLEDVDGAVSQLILSSPCVYLPYYVGGMFFFALREQAETVLGSQFDPKAFHTVLLENGAIPLDMIEKKVEAYLAAITESQKNAAAA